MYEYSYALWLGAAVLTVIFQPNGQTPARGYGGSMWCKLTYKPHSGNPLARKYSLVHRTINCKVRKKWENPHIYIARLPGLKVMQLTKPCNLVISEYMIYIVALRTNNGITSASRSSIICSTQHLNFCSGIKNG